MRLPTLAVHLLLGVATFACSAETGSKPGGGFGGPAAGGGGSGPRVNGGGGTSGLILEEGAQTSQSPATGDNLLNIQTNTLLTPLCSAECKGFSDDADPSVARVVIEGGLTEAQRAALDTSGSGGSLCVSEPATGSIFPAAWTRPRFNAVGASGPAKITLSTPRMQHELVMYSASLPAYLPLDVWTALSQSVHNEDISYTILSGGQQGSGSFQIAPVATGGSMVFWGSTGAVPGEQSNALYGFRVGDEAVVRVIYPGDIQGTAVDDNANVRNRDNTQPGKSTCVGCHSSSPDGGVVASMDHWGFNTRVYSIEPGLAGAAPDWLTPAGAAMASMTWMGAPVFSSGDWATGARRMVTTWSVRDFANNQEHRTHDGALLSNSPTELIWMDLASTADVPVDLRTITPAEYNNDGQLLQKALVRMKGTSWDTIPRTGDPNSPVLPDWSHDGKTVVYTSTDVPQDGRVGGAQVVDLYTLPADGGVATPLSGADSPDFEYYPDYSPDDRLIAFNKVQKFATNAAREDSWDHVYYRPDSDIYVIPSSGGVATKLESNSAVCGGTTGQLYNSWAKWSPSTAGGGGRQYYFLIFSTSRNSPFELDRGSSRKSPASQLYMATVILEADGSITSGAAIYLWNQSRLVVGEGDSATVSELGTNNVTPAWDQFKIPAIPPHVVIK